MSIATLYDEILGAARGALFRALNEPQQLLQDLSLFLLWIVSYVKQCSMGGFTFSTIPRIFILIRHVTRRPDADKRARAKTGTPHPSKKQGTSPSPVTVKSRARSKSPARKRKTPPPEAEPVAA